MSSNTAKVLVHAIMACSAALVLLSEACHTGCAASFTRGM